VAKGGMTKDVLNLGRDACLGFYFGKCPMFQNIGDGSIKLFLLIV
jgi:hypothetical protein